MTEIKPQTSAVAPFCMHWVDRWGCNHYADQKEPHPENATPLFTHPVRPMSDEDAQLMWDKACKDTPQKPGWCRHIRYARMVEAHIKGATE